MSFSRDILYLDTNNFYRRLVGYNAERFPDRFEKDVYMWVYEEEVSGDQKNVNRIVT